VLLAVGREHVLDVQLAADLAVVADLPDAVVGQHGRVGEGLLAAVPQCLEGHAGVDDDLLDQVFAGLGVAVLERGPGIADDLGQHAQEDLVQLGP
jgi:hypothetical protein